MTDIKLKKVKLKGNESFNFREGWLRKGMRCVAECDTLFSQDDVMERLGVGSKMVKSIRFWLQATRLCKEIYINSGRGRALEITDDFGKVIMRYDPYFDDLFTLFLVHYQIVSNIDFCVVWHLFFNNYDGQNFTKENMIENCSYYLDKHMVEGSTYSNSLFADDCSSVLRMYSNENGDWDAYSNSTNDLHPEDSLECPLSDLGLLQRTSSKRGTYMKTKPGRDRLDKLAVLYVISQNLIAQNRDSVSIADLQAADNNVGKVFNLSRVMINEYLDQLRIAGYLTMNRTAGLDMVYLNSRLEPQDIMVEYYKKAQV